MMLLNAGCGTHYAPGWVNTDVWENDDTRPDVRVKPGEPYPFDDNTFDAIFLGHVVEHIDWSLLPAFLRDMSRIAKSDAPMLIVGPDVYRTIDRWRNGHEPWWMVQSVLEHQDVNADNHGSDEVWDGATHHWNCHEERVVTLVTSLGFPNIQAMSDIVPDGNDWQDPGNGEIVWPIVAKAPWQCAVRFTNM
jgi:predicted SAM-dependent methyltransferase